MALITVAFPTIEPVTASDVAVSARLDGGEFDTHINGVLIPAFRSEAEHRLGRRLITQTVELVLDGFPAMQDIDLLLPDVQSIVSVKYLDSAGIQQTADPAMYVLDADSFPCWLLPVTSWPATGDYANAVRVRFTVGYGPSSSDVPQSIRFWIIAQVCAAIDKQTPPAWVDRLLDADTVFRAV